MTTDHARPDTRRRRTAPLLWASGGLAAAVLVLGVNGTLSSWTTAILSNDDNHAGTAASVVLQETGPDSTGASFTCSTSGTTTNTATCNQINKYGDAGVAADNTLTPGDTVSTTVTMSNTASGDAATFTMAPGACSSVYNTGADADSAPALADDLCTEMTVAVSCTGDQTLTVATTSLANFAAGAPYSFSDGLASGETSTCVFTVAVPADAPANYSGQTVTQPIVWTLSA